MKSNFLYISLIAVGLPVSTLAQNSSKMETTSRASINQSSDTTRSASGTISSETENNVKVKRTKGEYKMKSEGERGKRKVEIDKDGTTTITLDTDGEGKSKFTYPAPEWAKGHDYRNDRPVYFPDYYMFYDPSKGYTYWSDGTWQTFHTMPEYLEKVDWTTARIEVLNELEMNATPEREWRSYSERYPAKDIEIDIQIPDID